MSDSKEITEFFDTLAKVLLRCWIFGFVLLFGMFGVFLLAGDHVHRLQGKVFDLSPHESVLIFHCYMVVMKLLVLIFFFIPWLAIQRVLRGRKA